MSVTIAILLIIAVIIGITATVTNIFIALSFFAVYEQVKVNEILITSNKKGCDHCLKGVDLLDHSMAIRNKNELWSFKRDSDDFVKIKFCPNCGRQLLGNSQ